MESTSVRAAAEISSMARSNASSFTFEGLVKPLSLRTNCSEAARISSSVAGGSKWKSGLMFLHMAQGLLQARPLSALVTDTEREAGTVTVFEKRNRVLAAHAEQAFEISHAQGLLGLEVAAQRLLDEIP